MTDEGLPEGAADYVPIPPAPPTTRPVRRVTHHLCRECRRPVAKPGQMQRSFCRSCEDYVAVVQVVVDYE